MNKKRKFQIVVMIPVITVLIVLGILTFVLIAGSAKEEPPTALASAAPMTEVAQ
jgi:flagellar basal body-associated protein FliL